jgi:hypothetical protein
MSIEYTCADCGAVTEVADELAGHRTRCRKCNMPGVVPVPRRRPPTTGAGALATARVALWALCVCWVALLALSYLRGGGAAETTCWVLIAYASCFAIDSALRAFGGR